MLQRLVFYSFFFFCGLAGNTQLPAAPNRLSAFGGFQSENFRWSIAGNIYGQNPDILSELVWKNVAGPVLGFLYDRKIKKRFFLQLGFSKSHTIKGQATDTDYAGDNRTNQSYHIMLSSNEGGSVTAEAAAGMILNASSLFQWNAALGFGFAQQSRMLTTTGEANRLRSSYRSGWHSMFMRTSVLRQLGGAWEIEAAAQCNLGTYAAKADWNLVDNYRHPVSFEHNAQSVGLDLATRVYYANRPQLKLFLQLQFQRALTSKGDDLLYLANGDVLRSRFNGAERNLARMGAGACFLF